MFSAADLIQTFSKAPGVIRPSASNTAPRPLEPKTYVCAQKHVIRLKSKTALQSCPVCRDLTPDAMMDRARHVTDRKVVHCETHGDHVAMLITPPRPNAASYWTQCVECLHDKDRADSEARAEAERQLARLAQSQRLAGIIATPKRYLTESLDTYVPQTSQQTSVLQKVKEYVTKFDEHSAVGRGFVMTGQVGTGKTHLAYGVMHALQARGLRAACLNLSEFFDLFKSTFSGNAENDEEPSLSEAKVFHMLTTVDLLILDEIGQDGDEFGARELSSWRHSTLFNVIDRRSKDLRPTAIVSNREPRQLVGILGRAMVSRISQANARLFVLDGADFRGGR